MSKRTPSQIIGDDALTQLIFEGYQVVPAPSPSDRVAPAFTNHALSRMWVALLNSNCGSREGSPTYSNINFNVLLRDLFFAAHDISGDAATPYPSDQRTWHPVESAPKTGEEFIARTCLLYTSPSPRD